MILFLVNASWSDIAVVFPEGVGSSFSIPKGETKKVSYDSGSKTYGSEVAVTTEVLNKGLYSTDLDVFLINDGTTESKPYKIKEGNRETRIINNTNGILYLQGMGGGTNRTVDKYSYTKFRFIQRSNIDEIIPDQHDVNVELTKIRDGAVLLGETYINEVVLFNSDKIYLLDFVR